MRIEVYWKGILFYEADAEEDYDWYVPYFTIIDREHYKLEDRVKYLQKIAYYFRLEVESRLSLMNISQYTMYLVFPSRFNNWSMHEILQILDK